MSQEKLKTVLFNFKKSLFIHDLNQEFRGNVTLIENQNQTQNLF